MDINRRVSLRCILPMFIPFFMLAVSYGQAASTSTTLAVSPASPVASGTVVTLTATVVSGTTPVSPGQVKFCNAAATHCEDSALLATEQLTSAGIATYKFRPGTGSHSYQAVFVGTSSYAKSASTAAALTVSGLYPTTTTIAESGAVDDYTLTATVAGLGSVLPLGGDVSFLDTTNGNASQGSVALKDAGQSFAVSSVPVPGDEPLYVAVGDFNGDGILDLATANQGANTVTVMLGNGDGTFTFKSSLTVGNVPSFIAVGDFNGDSIPDLAVANSVDGTVTVLLGNGDGTFTTVSTLSVGSNPEYVAVGDFNGDGISDLAVANEDSSTVTVLLGNGDGTFTATSTLSIDGGPAAIAVGDFNGDGILDLATSNWFGSSVTVLLGAGDGTFTATSTIDLTAGNRFIVTGDFNGDGIPDLAATEVDAGAVAVLLGNGDGTFTLKSTPSVGGAVSAIIPGDFNGDGITDLAMANFGSCATNVILGNGNGTFATPITTSSGCSSYTVNAGNFRGDGLPDLVVGLQSYGQFNPASVAVLLNQPSMATATLSNVPVSGTEPHQVVASYPGDTNFSSSTSSSVPLLAAQIATTLNVSSSVNSTSVGSPITLSATLTPYSLEGFTTNGEAVIFFDGGAGIGGGTLSAGVATLTTTSFGAGTHTITAQYLGDINFSASATSGSVSVVVTVPQATPTLTLSSSANPSIQGAPLTLRAVLSPYIVGTATTDGEIVTFYNGGTSIGTGTLSSGVAMLNIASLPNGIYTLTATYAGDTNFVGATSNSLMEGVAASPSTTYVVTTSTDTTNGVAANCTGAPAPNCSLRDALAAATAKGAANITFDPTVFATPQTIFLGSAGGLTIPSNTTINIIGPTTGSGATQENLVTVGGGGPVFTINTAIASISGLTITSGFTLYNGGGILNDGVLTVSDSTISGNNTGGEYSIGGGIENDGFMTLLNSTVTGNSAGVTFEGCMSCGVVGGGIDNQGTLTITNSTIVGNSVYVTLESNPGITDATGYGGGINNNGTLTMTNSIVAGNSTNGLAPGGDIDVYVGGAGIYGSVTTGTNNIISGNTANGSEDDCDNGSCGTTGVTGNIVGASALLAPLGNYGGPTQTAPPLPGSLAICGGLVADIPPGITTDQRGFPRTTTYGSNPPCVDSGSVQTNYSVAFSTQPPATVAPNTNFTAALQLSESGSPFPVAGVAIPLSLGTGNNGTLSGNSASTIANGIATFSQLQVSAAGTGDTLVAALPLTTVPPPAPLTAPISANATSTSFNVVTTQSATTTTLTTSATSAVVGTSVTFTTSVSPSATSPAPTGTIQFYDGGSPLGSAVTLTAGSASYSTASLAPGTHTITADYSGDTNFASSTSAAITENIGDVTPVVGSPSVSVAPGGSVTETLTITALGGLNETTTFACSGLPAGASCSFNPTSVTGSGSTTLTVTTTGSTAALTPEGRWLPGGGAALACIILLIWPNRRRRWAQMLGILMLCFVFSTIGCGGGNGFHGGGGTGSSGTPAGTYTITVTTTTGSGTSAISNTVTFQLIVT